MLNKIKKKTNKQISQPSVPIQGINLNILHNVEGCNSSSILKKKTKNKTKVPMPSVYKLITVWRYQSKITQINDQINNI